MSKIVRMAEWTVVIIGTLISLTLFLMKTFISFSVTSKVYSLNVITLFFAILIYTALFVGIRILSKKICCDRKAIGLCIASTMLFESLFCLSLIVGARFYFSSDAGVIYQLALRFLEGDYSAVIPKDSYLSIYPQQYGMIFIFETIMKVLHVKNGMIFQLTNIVLVLLGTLAGYGIVWKIKPSRDAVISFSILQITFFPLFFFVAVAYGDLPATCLTIMAIYGVIKIFQDKKYYWLWMIATSLVLIVDCMFKRNAIICLIAISLTVLVMILRKFDIKKVIWLVIAFTLSVSAVPIIQNGYELQAGQESGKGLPMITYIAMSMQEGLGAPGAWSGYHTDLFIKNDYDYDDTSEQAMEDIRESLAVFRQDPLYMLEFYKRKVAYQWTEGTFDGIAWGLGNGFAADKSPWVESICNGKSMFIFEIICNGHQCVVYLLFFIFMISTWKNVWNKKPLSVEKMVLIVILIGGFLFELIWESSSRYVMMYYAMMIPLVAGTTAEIYENLRKK